MDEYDFAYNTFDNLTIDDDGLNDINQTSQQGGSMDLPYNTSWNMDLKSSENTILQWWTKSINATDVIEYANCNGTDRNMYVTITRVKVGSSNSNKKIPVKAREMNAVGTSAEHVTLVFTNH